MWDTKRQIIWLAAGFLLGTLILYQHAHDDPEGFDPAYFALLEIILVAVIGMMFYFYTRKRG
ncbi:MAG: hypothetical protein ACRD9R_15710 [Pyrinomonadaceae bacterium]